jgi:hypothetical protein
MVLGFQNALSKSSLPFSFSTTTATAAATTTTASVTTSKSRLTGPSIQEQNQYQQPPPKEDNYSLSPIITAARFALLQPEESTDITATRLPCRRHIKRRQARNHQKQLNRNKNRDDEELDDQFSNYFEDYDDDTLMMMLVQRRQRLIPCSSVTQPVALQAKYKANPNLHSRRFTTSNATASSLTTTETDLSTTAKSSPSETRGGSSTAIATAAATVAAHRPLFFWENMVSGAVSRSVAQTIMHPANCMKTMLQNSNDVSFRQLCHPQMFRRLTMGAGANFILSIPHGAVNFAVLEFVRGRLNIAMDTIPALNKRKDALGPALDFMSSCISTISCSIVSTPQMMITDVSNTKIQYADLG